MEVGMWRLEIGGWKSEDKSEDESRRLKIRSGGWRRDWGAESRLID